MSEQRDEFERRLERTWMWALHEDLLYVYRANVFAVSEALLITALAVVSQGQVRKPLLIWTIVIAGELFTLVWLYASGVQYFYTVKPIHDVLRDAMYDWFRIE